MRCGPGLVLPLMFGIIGRINPMTTDERLAKAMGWNYIPSLMGYYVKSERIFLCRDWHPSSPTAPDALHQCKLVWDRLTDDQRHSIYFKLFTGCGTAVGGINRFLCAPTLSAAIAAVLEDSDA